MFNIIMRTAMLYFIVVLAIRIMGKRQIGDMQPGELVITILISEIAAVPIQDLNQPVLTGAVAVFTLAFLEILISVIAMKWLPFHRLFYGTSAILIRDGQLDKKALKKLRIAAPDLLEVLRNQSIFDISEVAYAILETNGQLSVMMKPDYQTLTVGNRDGSKCEHRMQCLVISDGRVLKESLKIIGKDKKDIEKYVSDKNLRIKDIFIMTCDSKMNVNIIKKENGR